MELIRLLVYFNLAFSCDVPILEALWVTGDRVAAEISLILPRLKYQLAEWGFTFVPWNLLWFRGDSRVLGAYKECRMSRGNLFPWGQCCALHESHKKDFSFQPSYPHNSYQIWDESEQSLQKIPTRDSWYHLLLCYLKPADIELKFTYFLECKK
jgi:hypothetical protein